MKNKKGKLRVIELWDGSAWLNSCILYKSEMTSFFRWVTAFKGATKARYRFPGCSAWHYVFSNNF